MSLLRTLPQFELPLQSGAPRIGFDWEGRSGSVLSSTTEFNRVLDHRDTILGLPACIICGDPHDVKRCHIIPEEENWTDLKKRGWIPRAAKRSPVHEPRNSMIMCPSHHANFNHYRFYIRFSPEKFIFINHNNIKFIEGFHGKAIALDTTDRYAPFATLFIIHEWRVRGFNPFQPVVPVIPAKIVWQDWIGSCGVYDEDIGFVRNRAHAPVAAPPDDNNNLFRLSQSPFQPSTSSSGPTEGVALPPLNNDVIAEILAATRAQPSWRACELENTSWNGTAEENVKKYLDLS